MNKLITYLKSDGRAGFAVFVVSVTLVLSLALIGMTAPKQSNAAAINWSATPEPKILKAESLIDEDKAAMLSKINTLEIAVTNLVQRVEALEKICTR